MEAIEKFKRQHPLSRKPLDRWVDIMTASAWSTLAQLKTTFPSADYVNPGYVVFNIKGNNFRVITVVVFQAGIVRIAHVFTHNEYNSWRA